MTDPTLAEVLDGHTEPIDPEFLGTACPDCAITVAHPALAEHLVAVHGHLPD